jgi:protein dithiol oxidoreductase (disulfide-forming)
MRKLTLLIGLLVATIAGSAAALELKEGQHYTTFNPPRATEARDRIEVTEFFWYGCSHCFNLEPLLQKWQKKLPKDVSFRRVPAVFPGKDGKPGNWASGTKLYYTLEAMGLLEKFHGEILDSIHIDRINLLDEKVMLDWLGKKGVDTKKFADTYNSFAIQSKVLRAMQMTEAHGLDGVPALIVDGRYKPSASGAAGSFEDIFVVVDQLIDKARKDRAKK